MYKIMLLVRDSETKPLWTEYREDGTVFETDDMEASFKKHKEMGCVCYENPSMGIYFISDPDGYWLEIVPQK